MSFCGLLRFGIPLGQNPVGTKSRWDLGIFPLWYAASGKYLSTPSAPSALRFGPSPSPPRSVTVTTAHIPREHNAATDDCGVARHVL